MTPPQPPQSPRPKAAKPLSRVFLGLTRVLQSIGGWMKANLFTSKGLEVAAVLIGAASAWFAYQAASEAARSTQVSAASTQGELLNDILREYAQDSVLDDILLLRAYQREHPNLESAFRDDRQHRYDQVREVDHARRRLAKYFLKIHKLHKAGILRGDILREAVTPSQVDLYIELVEPLTCATGKLASQCEREVGTFLRGLFPYHDVMLHNNPKPAARPTPVTPPPRVPLAPL